MTQPYPCRQRFSIPLRKLLLAAATRPASPQTATPRTLGAGLRGPLSPWRVRPGRPEIRNISKRVLRGALGPGRDPQI